MKHIAKKRFGQNFLTDQSIIASLIDAINPAENQTIVEIGPGLGALTKPLLRKITRLEVVEIDRDIVAWMQTEYAKPAYAKNELIIHNVDALKFDFASLTNSSSSFAMDARQLGGGDEIVHKVQRGADNAANDADALKMKKLRVTGNLPYNISTPILFHLLDNLPSIVDMHFMLQKEVVERMVAKPSTPAYGRLSVMLQYHLDMQYLLTVPPEAFEPAPKVESAFVRCTPHAALPFVAQDTALFAKVVLAAFSQRRKTIRNTLKDFLSDDDYLKINSCSQTSAVAQIKIGSQLRAENLSVQDFVAISNYISN